MHVTGWTYSYSILLLAVTVVIGASILFLRWATIVLRFYAVNGTITQAAVWLRVDLCANDDVVDKIDVSDREFGFIVILFYALTFVASLLLYTCVYFYSS